MTIAEGQITMKEGDRVKQPTKSENKLFASAQPDK